MIQKCENRREWLLARQGGIGASDVAAILGRDRFRSPWAVWQEKVDPLPDEPDEEPRRNHPTDAEVGLLLEDDIAELFGRHCFDEDLPARWSIHDPGKFTMYWADGDLPLFCTPDRLIFDFARSFVTPDSYIVDFATALASNGLAVLELKTAKQEQARRFKREFPEEHQVQTQMQMHCTELNLVYFAVFLWGSDFKWFKQERSQRFIDAVIPKLRRFWEYVEAKAPPPTDFSPATTQALSAHYNEPEDNELQLGDEFDGVEANLTRWEAKAAEADRKITGFKNQVRGALGNATAGVAPDGSYWTWRPDKRGRRTIRHKGGKADE